MTAPPRVAVVVPGLEEGGGVPTVGLTLERLLRESGRYRPELVSLPMSRRDRASVRLLAPRSWLHGPRVEAGQCHGRPFRHVGAWGGELEFQRVRARRPLTRLLESCDAVQIVAGTPYWALVARGLRRPVALQVATLVGVERVERVRTTRGALRPWRAAMDALAVRLEDAGLRVPDAIFVENQWMFEHLVARLGPERVILAPPGVDTERFRPAPPSAPPSPGAILSVGRFGDPRKRIGLLFEAYARLCAAMPDAPPLRLAGHSGPSAADWRRAEALGIRSRIEFHRDAAPDLLLRLYQQATLFVLASDEEGLGLVLLEAMACGLPVVSTDCGGPRTSVLDGETGHLVPRGDAAALARRMQEILTDPVRRARMAERARARAAEHFSLAATGRPFLAWYDRVCAPRGSSARG